MAAEQLTYEQIAERLGISREAARAIVKRHRLPRSRSNDGGKVLVTVDLAEVAHKPLPARSPRGHHPATEAVMLLQAKVETLEAELAAEQQRSGGHRADFERERARVDQLLSELLTATADLMAARERSPRQTSVPTVPARPARWWSWRRAG